MKTMKILILALTSLMFIGCSTEDDFVAPPETTIITPPNTNNDCRCNFEISIPVYDQFDNITGYYIDTMGGLLAPCGLNSEEILAYLVETDPAFDENSIIDNLQCYSN